MEILENVRRQLENIQKFRKLDKLKRVVQKDGTTSVLYKNISKKRRRYFYDFYTTLLDSSWFLKLLLLFFLSDTMLLLGRPPDPELRGDSLLADTGLETS